MSRRRAHTATGSTRRRTLLAGQPAAAHLRHRVLVAQEHDVEVVDRVLDQVPLVDPAIAVHQHGLDVEPERVRVRGSPSQIADLSQ
jgi:hypothetical protein